MRIRLNNKKGESKMKLKNSLMFLSSLMLFVIVGCSSDDDNDDDGTALIDTPTNTHLRVGSVVGKAAFLIQVK